MPDIVWRPTALDDLRSIIDFLASENPTAALRLWSEIDGKVGRLADAPRLYRRGRVAGTREMIVRQIYVIV